MTRCTTINFQLSIMSKCVASIKVLKVPSKLLLGKHMFTLTYIDLEYETRFSFVIWNDDRTKIIVFPSFQFATRLNSPNSYELEVINEHWHINLYINIGISNWNNWSFDPTKMKFFYFILVPFTISDIQVPETV